MIDPGSNLPPEESEFTQKMYTDIIKKQDRRRKRVFTAILTLAVSAVILGGIIGWRAAS